MQVKKITQFLSFSLINFWYPFCVIWIHSDYTSRARCRSILIQNRNHNNKSLVPKIEICPKYFLDKNPQNSHSVFSTVHVVCKKKPRTIHDLEPFTSYGGRGSWLKVFIWWREGSFWKNLALSMMIVNCC